MCVCVCVCVCVCDDDDGEQLCDSAMSMDVVSCAVVFACACVGVWDLHSYGCSVSVVCMYTV